MKNRVLLFWLALMFLFAGSFSILYATGILGRKREPAAVSQGHATESKDEKSAVQSSIGHEVNDFSLFDQRGKPFHASDLRGSIWIASVFFSTCPGVCPQQNQQLKQFQNEFGDAGVHCVSITCDPVTDTSAVLAKYAARFDANPDRWHFLTGDMKEIERVGSDIFQIIMGPQAHSQRFFLVDRDGKIQDSFLSIDALAMAKLRKTLKEMLAAEAGGSPPAATESETQDATGEATAAEITEPTSEPATEK